MASCVSNLLLLASVAASSDWTKRLDHGRVLGFPSYEEANQLLEEFLQQNPDELVKQNIGESYEKRPINAYVLGTKNGRLRRPPQVLLTSLTHAREPAGLTVLLYFLGHLLDLYRQRDPQAVYVLESREIWFVPFVNPDGYIANAGLRSKVIRKNRRKTCSSSVNGGVDINRNFGTHWSSEFGGCDEEHGGTKPFSEPETLALKKICDENNFKTAMNFHAFGSMLTHPYNWAKRDMLKDDDKLVYSEIGKVFGWPKFGPAIRTVGYTASGESDDWMYDARHIISMSPEVGPESGGFWPRREMIAGIDSRNFPRNLYVVMKAGVQLSLSWAHYARSGESPPGSDSLPGGLPKDILSLRIANQGLSASMGESVGIAIRGAVQEGSNAGGGPAAVFVSEAGTTPAFVKQSKQPILVGKLGPLLRRSAQTLRFFIAQALEPGEAVTRSLEICIAEAYGTASSSTTTACHCLGPAELPSVVSAASPFHEVRRESFALSTGGSSNTQSALCEAAATAQTSSFPATTSAPTTSVAASATIPAQVSTPQAAILESTAAPAANPSTATTQQAPVPSSPSAAATVSGTSPAPAQLPLEKPEAAVSPALPLAAATVSRTSLAPAKLPLAKPDAVVSAAQVKASLDAQVADNAMGTWVLLAMGITAMSMGVCLLTQGLVKTRTSVAKRAPSALDFERIPGPQASRQEESDDLGFSKPSQV